jgi:hypothetical protein
LLRQFLQDLKPGLEARCSSLLVHPGYLKPSAGRASTKRFQQTVTGIKMNRSLGRSPKRGFLSVIFSKALTIGVLSVALPLLGHTQPSVAQTCNVFGCSQPGAGACNPFGCPNPGANPCTPFGCPASPTPAAAPAAQPPVIYQPPQTPVIYQPQPQIGGSPQAIANCMKNLMYEQRLVCTRSYCQNAR